MNSILLILASVAVATQLTWCMPAVEVPKDICPVEIEDWKNDYNYDLSDWHGNLLFLISS